MTVETAVNYTLTLNSTEREELLRLLETSLKEIHAERRRTEAPRYHEEVVQEETLLKNLIEKVRKLGCECS